MLCVPDERDVSPLKDEASYVRPVALSVADTMNFANKPFSPFSIVSVKVYEMSTLPFHGERGRAATPLMAALSASTDNAIAMMPQILNPLLIF
jgi:hypothetical protein